MSDTIENIKKEYATNSVKIRLHHRKDSKKFFNEINQNELMDIKQINSLEYVLKGQSAEQFGGNKSCIVLMFFLKKSV